MSKAETHLIESSNSSIRDNLARFNRRSKRFSKTFEMLTITLDLFINYKNIPYAIKYWHCLERGPAVFAKDGHLIFGGEYIQRITGGRFSRKGGG